MNRRGSNGGFTLLEMVTVVAIMSLLVGITFPLTELYLRSKLEDTTELEMTTLADAIAEFYRDIEAFPDDLSDLVAPDPPIDGWMGPYVQLDFSDAEEDLDDYRYDAWRMPYQLTVIDASTRRLTSFGENRTNEGGDGDDIVLDVDVGYVMRDLTRRELEILNTAVIAYNADFLFSNPLSSDYPTLLGQLQAAGYLPPDAESTQRYLQDAWGQTYITNASNPVVEILSAGTP